MPPCDYGLQRRPDLRRVRRVRATLYSPVLQHAIGRGNILENEVAAALADQFETRMVMFNSFYPPIPTMKVGGEVEAEVLRYYLVVHYDS